MPVQLWIQPTQLRLELGEIDVSLLALYRASMTSPIVPDAEISAPWAVTPAWGSGHASEPGDPRSEEIRASWALTAGLHFYILVPWYQ
jgi:hypothetical protein